MQFFSLFRKGHKIYDQLKRICVSTDWDRESFTMSEVMCITSFIPTARLCKESLVNFVLFLILNHHNLKSSH